jgi:hypothetical protein
VITLTDPLSPALVTPVDSDTDPLTGDEAVDNEIAPLAALVPVPAPLDTVTAPPLVTPPPLLSEIAPPTAPPLLLAPF